MQEKAQAPSWMEAVYADASELALAGLAGRARAGAIRRRAQVLGSTFVASRSSRENSGQHHLWISWTCLEHLGAGKSIIVNRVVELNLQKLERGMLLGQADTRKALQFTVAMIATREVMVCTPDAALGFLVLAWFRLVKVHAALRNDDAQRMSFGCNEVTDAGLFWDPGRKCEC